MSDLASYISGIRARGISADELSTENLTLIINECLYEYSRARPLLLDITFETVEDQQKYTWTEIGDADGITALKVLWNPSRDGDDLFEHWHGWLSKIGLDWTGEYWHLPSQEIVEQIKSAAWHANNDGSGYQIDDAGGDVYLTPVPDEDDITVYIVYTKAHAAVTTIPSADRDIFLDLVEARCGDWFVKSLAKASAAMRVKTPEYEIQLGEQVGYWRKQSKEMMESFHRKCQAGQAAAGRT